MVYRNNISKVKVSNLEANQFTVLIRSFMETPTILVPHQPHLLRPQLAHARTCM